jgi:hypothetical protein
MLLYAHLSRPPAAPAGSPAGCQLCVSFRLDGQRRRANRLRPRFDRDALPLLAAGDLVAVFPEGLKGVGKMYRERYRLARFGRGGFVRWRDKRRCRCCPSPSSAPRRFIP